MGWMIGFGVMAVLVVGLAGMRRGEQPPWTVSDESMQVEPLLPVKARLRSPGRRRLPDRLTLQGFHSCCRPGSSGGSCFAPSCWAPPSDFSQGHSQGGHGMIRPEVGP